MEGGLAFAHTLPSWTADDGDVGSDVELEEPQMHVRGDDGAWHRRAIGHATTACGKPIARLGQQLRHETYSGCLCDEGCFSNYELDLADRANAAEVRDLSDLTDPTDGDDR